MITFKETQTMIVEKTIELPYYTKTPSGGYYEKVVSSEKTIQVTENSIKVLNFVSTNETEITEDEFNEFYNKTLKLITHD
jgi:hypothetical protein